MVVELVNLLQQELLKQLVELGFESGRMKTGTPPRVDGRSLDFSKMIINLEMIIQKNFLIQILLNH